MMMTRVVRLKATHFRGMVVDEFGVVEETPIFTSRQAAKEEAAAKRRMYSKGIRKGLRVKTRTERMPS